MEQQGVAVPHVKARQHHREPIDNGADVTHGRRIKQGVDDLSVIRAKLGKASKSRTSAHPTETITHRCTLPGAPAAHLTHEACHVSGRALWPAPPSVDQVADTITVATFNLHGGIDAWGRPYDVVDAVSSLGVDVVFLQECWTPEEGPSDPELVAKAMGGTFVVEQLASGRRAGPHPDAPEAWGRLRSFVDGDHGLYLDSKRALGKSLAASERVAQGEPGSWGIAIVSRIELTMTASIGLGTLPRDHTERALLHATCQVGDTTWHVGCVHMSHLIHGSPRHFRELRHAVGAIAPPDAPLVLGGDMNAWGPLVSLQIPRLRRAVKGATWPAWRPHSQLDHLLVSSAVDVVEGTVVDERSSDHRPVRAILKARHG